MLLMKKRWQIRRKGFCKAIGGPFVFVDKIESAHRFKWWASLVKTLLNIPDATPLPWIDGTIYSVEEIK